MRILLADTDQNPEIIRSLLESLGHTVVEAADGKQAITAALKYRPDLVFMDLNLPVVDGFQAAGALRAISTFENLPIIAMTAHPETLSKQKALEAGCDRFLQ